MLYCQFSNLCWIWSSAKVNSACLLRIFNLSLRAMSCLRKTSRTPLKQFLYYCFEDKYYFLFKNDHFLKKKKKKKCELQKNLGNTDPRKYVFRNCISTYASEQDFKFLAQLYQTLDRNGSFTHSPTAIQRKTH